MSENTKHLILQRRGSRIRLAVLLLAVGVVASLAWFALEWRQVARRNDMREWIASREGVVVPAEAMFKTSDEAKQADRSGLVRTLFNDKEIAYVIMPRSASADDCSQIRAAFPELSDGIGVFWTPVLVNHRFMVAVQ